MKFRIIKNDFPIEGYKYNVQIYSKYGNTSEYYYCGYGKFFRRKAEAKQFIRDTIKAGYPSWYIKRRFEEFPGY